MSTIKLFARKSCTIAALLWLLCAISVGASSPSDASEPQELIGVWSKAVNPAASYTAPALKVHVTQNAIPSSGPRPAVSRRVTTVSRRRLSLVVRPVRGSASHVCWTAACRSVMCSRRRANVQPAMVRTSTTPVVLTRTSSSWFAPACPKVRRSVGAVPSVSH
jgi:hypothetical protein